MTTVPAADTGSDLADMLETLRQVHASGRTRTLEWRLSQLDAISRF